MSRPDGVSWSLRLRLVLGGRVPSCGLLGEGVTQATYKVAQPLVPSRLQRPAASSEGLIAPRDASILRAPGGSEEEDTGWKEGCVKAFKTTPCELSAP